MPKRQVKGKPDKPPGGGKPPKIDSATGAADGIGTASAISDDNEIAIPATDGTPSGLLLALTR